PLHDALPISVNNGRLLGAQPHATTSQPCPRYFCVHPPRRAGQALTSNTPSLQYPVAKHGTAWRRLNSGLGNRGHSSESEHHIYPITQRARELCRVSTTLHWCTDAGGVINSRAPFSTRAWILRKNQLHISG